MPIYEGSSEIDTLYEGGNQIDKVYEGSSLVYESYNYLEYAYVAAGSSHTYKVDSGGNSKWHRNDTDGNAIAIEARKDEKAVIGYEYNLIRFVDEDGNEIWTYSTGNNVRAVTFGPDDYIYYATDDGYIGKLNESATLVWQNSNTVFANNNKIIYDIEVDNQGVLAVAGQEYSGLYDSADGSEKVTRDEGNYNTFGVELDPENGRFYIAHGYPEVEVYDYSQWDLTYAHDAGDPTGNVKDVSFHPTNREVLASSMDDTLYKYSDGTFDLTLEQTTNVSDGNGVKWTPNRNIYVIDGWYNTLLKLDSSLNNSWGVNLDSTPRDISVTPGTFGTRTALWNELI